MERPGIVELFYSALLEPKDVEPLSQFLSPRVEWILSAADPQTLGEDLPSNAIKFSGREGFRELALYFRDRLHVISGDLTGCIPHHHLVFRLEECDCDLRKRVGWQKRISLPNLHFSAPKSSKSKYGSLGRWCLKVNGGGVLPSRVASAVHLAVQQRGLRWFGSGRAKVTLM
jgi:hypothetical protein